MTATMARSARRAVVVHLRVRASVHKRDSSFRSAAWLPFTGARQTRYEVWPAGR